MESDVKASRSKKNKKKRSKSQERERSKSNKINKKHKKSRVSKSPKSVSQKKNDDSDHPNDDSLVKKTYITDPIMHKKTDLSSNESRNIGHSRDKIESSKKHKRESSREHKRNRSSKDKVHKRYRSRSMSNHYRNRSPVREKEREKKIRISSDRSVSNIAKPRDHSDKTYEEENNFSTSVVDRIGRSHKIDLSDRYSLRKRYEEDRKHSKSHKRDFLRILIHGFKREETENISENELESIICPSVLATVSLEEPFEQAEQNRREAELRAKDGAKTELVSESKTVISEEDSNLAAQLVCIDKEDEKWTDLEARQSLLWPHDSSLSFCASINAKHFQKSRIFNEKFSDKKWSSVTISEFLNLSDESVMRSNPFMIKQDLDDTNSLFDSDKLHKNLLANIPLAEAFITNRELMKFDKCKNTESPKPLPRCHLLQEEYRKKLKCL